jgi:hypothetical protein
MSTNHTPTRARRRARQAAAGGVLLALGALAGCSTIAHEAIPTAGASTATVTVPTAKPPCNGTVVTVRWDELTVCDVSPPQRLDVVFDESFWGEAWGGDASMLAVEQECDDMGGRDLIGFSADHPDALVCEGVDY